MTRSLLDDPEAPFTPAEIATIKAGAPNWVAKSPEGADIVMVTRATIRSAMARWPTMVPGYVQAPAKGLAPTATERYPNSPGMSRGSK